MEFDKSKVYTFADANAIKIGSKGYVADSYASLITIVRNSDNCCLTTLLEISEVGFPFISKSKSGGRCAWQYFYLLEEPKEKIKRPCTMEELIEMLKVQVIPMLKTTIGNLHFTVESMSDNNVYVGGGNYAYQELCEQYTLLDGTELWVEEHKDEE